MAHHRNAGAQNTVNRLDHLSAALQLDCISTRLFHDANSGVQGYFGVALVRAKGHVHDHKRTFNGPHHRGGVINHLIEGDGKRGFVAGHHIGGGVAHQNDIYLRHVEQGCNRVIVGGQHRDTLTLVAHALQCIGRNFADIFG